MLDKNFLEELSNRLSSLVPKLVPMAKDVQEEMRTKIEQQLKKSFAVLDLMGREEFDQHSDTLKRAEQRIEDLEATILELGKRLDEFEKSSPDH
ncbi:MAG: hypothetical protein COA96_02645 [SAR86 cluster bacterium]|uniref:Ubiquinone biosynthesis accessory factor UbiK n=1 Tax=SAR86 cluster bacterium TaxID=2030880 RepID=A0A2A5B9S7_9GAMM|nr:MAG: hypothetical protein COA96_02645 [SAR86 cluster bacterium]